MENKMAIAIVALMVAALAAPLVMAADPTYTASVKTGQDTSTVVTTAGFENVLQDSVNTITDSLTLTNIGGWDAAVKAKCESQSANSGVTEYGLIGGTDVSGTPVYIGGDKLKLGATGYLVELTNDGQDKVIDVGTGNNKVPATGSVKYNAELTVPSGQTVDSYSGLVTITFSNAP